METTTVDATTKALGSAASRRSVLRGLAAGFFAAAGGAAVLQNADARKSKGSERCLRPGTFCSSNKQCCPDTTGYVCAVAANASNSDTTCCGGEGAVCGGANRDGDAVGPVCCARFRCSTGDPDAPGFKPFRKGVCVRARDM